MYLINPRSKNQRLAIGKISGIGGVDKYHFNVILDNWFKVDVQEVLQGNIPLMVENVDADQTEIQHVKGGNAIWDQKYLKFIT